MKAVIFCIILLLAAPVFGQEEEKVKRPFPFDEFSISVNRTNMTSSKLQNRFGCGAGMYHSSTLSKQWNYLLGLEYNYTSLFADLISDGPRYHEENITFHIHTISLMPAAFRFNMGKNIKYFLESGLLLGVSIANKKGEAYSMNPLPTPENPDQYVSTKPEGGIGLNGNLFLGIGMRIPVKGIEWVIKTDYNLGISAITGYKDFQYYRLGVGIRKKK
jgi:hypothetical protein